MSYAMSAALQSAIYGQLASDPALQGLVGDAIYDAPPAGVLPETYVSLGPEDVQDRSDASGGGALHTFTVSVSTENDGFQKAKDVAAAVSDALVDQELNLSRGRLVSLRFWRATARRVDASRRRRIDLRFRARVEDN